MIRLGQFEQARTACETAIALYRQYDQRPPPGFGTDPLGVMGLLACTVGEYIDAIAFADEALQRAMPDDQRGRMFLLYVLANATYSLGRFEKALGDARKAYQISSTLGDNYFGTYILILLGNIVQALEDYDQAHEYYQTSYRLKENLNEQVGMAFALNCMARIAWLKMDYQEAKRCFQQGHDLYQKMNDPGGLATSLLGLGDTALAQGDHTFARAHFHKALEIALHIQWTPLILAILTGVSDLLVQEGDYQQVGRLLPLVIRHPANEPPTRKRAESLRQRTQQAVNLEDGSRMEPHDDADLDSVAAVLLDWLKLPARPLTANASVLQTAAQGLVDRLSERELEILMLMAAGYTNQQIAEKLIVVLGTVKAHNHNIFRKLDVANRVQAITRARELNLL